MQDERYGVASISELLKIQGILSFYRWDTFHFYIQVKGIPLQLRLLTSFV